MRRSHGGRRSSSAIRRRAGSGPPSTTRRPPRPPSTRIPSPWPTSSTTTRARPSGRWTSTSASPIVETASAPAASRATQLGPLAAPPERLIAPGGRPLPPLAAPRFGPTPRLGQTPWPPPRFESGTPAAFAPGCRRAARSAVSHRSPNLAAAKISSAETVAARLSHGATSSRLASGSPAPIRTTPTIAAYRPHAGSPTIVATTGGMPASTVIPITSASAPVAIAGGTSGTTSRFTSGATSESRPNMNSTTGVVAAWAANETPRISAIHRRGREGSAPARRAVKPEPHAMIPAVARTDSRKPASNAHSGSINSRPVTAQPRAAAAVPGLPSSRASRATPAITPARTTDGDGPTNAT